MMYVYTRMSLNLFCGEHIKTISRKNPSKIGDVCRQPPAACQKFEQPYPRRFGPKIQNSQFELFSKSTDAMRSYGLHIVKIRTLKGIVLKTQCFNFLFLWRKELCLDYLLYYSDMESFINKRLHHLSLVDRKKAFVMLCVVGLTSYCDEHEEPLDIVSLTKHCGMFLCVDCWIFLACDLTVNILFNFLI